MKKRNKSFFPVWTWGLMSLLIAAFVFVLGACKQPAVYEACICGRIAILPGSADGGNVQARTLLPSMTFDSFVFNFTKEGAPSETELTPNDNGYFILEPANYTVELQAFIGTSLAATGVSQLFTVNSGDNEPVIVYLSPVANSAQGTFAYTITYPAGAEAEIALQQWPDMLAVNLTPAALPTENGVTETLELVSGSYQLSVVVSKNGFSAGTTEAVHIYQLLTTTFNKHFSDEDFTTIQPPTTPNPPPVSPIKILHYWVDQHDNLITTSSATTVAAGETLAITAQGDGYVFQQWFLNGVDTEQSGNTFSFSSTIAGNHTISLFVEKAGKLYNTNIVVTVETEAVTDTRSVTIDMFDSGNDGWGGNGALRININGTDTASDVKVSTLNTLNTPTGQRNANTYIFTVSTGDIVELYWVVGAAQNENSFVAYYTGTPPIPAFSNSYWTGSNALVFRLRGSMNTLKDGTLLGSFTVQ